MAHLSVRHLVVTCSVVASILALHSSVLATPSKELATPATQSFLIDDDANVPILYFCLREHRELSTSALRDVIDAIQSELESDATLWFLHVHTHTRDPAVQQVTGFTEPLSHGEGLRKGRAIKVDVRTADAESPDLGRLQDRRHPQGAG